MNFNLESIYSSKVKPCGLKRIELPFLFESLTEGSVLCVGEGGEGGHEGVCATVLAKQKEGTKVHCIDICNYPAQSYTQDLIDAKRITFFRQDFIEFETTFKYDNLVCINVLEHFGFNNSHVILNYDLLAVQKMAQITAKKVILSVPYGYSPFIDNGTGLGGRVYTPERIATINAIFQKYGFQKTRDIVIADLFRDLNYRTVDEQTAYNLYCRDRFKHEFVRLLVFEKV